MISTFLLSLKQRTTSWKIHWQGLERPPDCEDRRVAVLEKMKFPSTCLRAEGKSFPKESLGDVEIVASVLYEAVHLSGAKADIERADVGSTLDFFLFLAWEGKFVAYLKWWVADISARLKAQKERPARPSWIPEEHEIPLMGGFRVFLKIHLRDAQLRRNCRRRLSLSDTLTMAKRAFPGVSDQFVDDELKSTFTALTTRQTEGPLEFGLQFELNRTMKEVFGKCKPISWSFQTPSSKGCVQNTQKDWGSLPLVTSLYQPCSCVSWDFEVIAPECRCTASFVDRLFRTAALESPDVRMVGIKEPLKVRPITAGPAYTYYALMSIQRHLWSVVSGRKPFHFTAGPIHSDLRPYLGDLPQGQEWMSGDYKGATNSIDPRVTDHCWDLYCDLMALPSLVRRLGRNALTRHRMRPVRLSTKEEFGDYRPQEHGQLMGSVISFPFLCLINFAVNRWFLELVNRRIYTLDEAPMLINGDDIAMPLDPQHYSAWKDFVGQVGLVPSVGKNYMSREFVQMNSVTFSYHPTLFHTDDFVRVPFFNMGLIRGWKAKGGGEKVGWLELLPSNAYGLAPRLEAALEAAMVENWPRVHEAFLIHHRPLLDLCPAGMSWFLPRALGGLGLRRLESTPYSRKGYQAASAIYHDLMNDGVALPSVFYGSGEVTVLSQIEKVLPVKLHYNELGRDPSTVLASRFWKAVGLGAIKFEQRQDPTECVRKFVRCMRSILRHDRGENNLMSPFELYMFSDENVVCFEESEETLQIASLPVTDLYMDYDLD